MTGGDDNNQDDDVGAAELARQPGAAGAAFHDVAMGRRRGGRIPEELWQAAAERARHDGLSATAARLRLSYYDLKRVASVSVREAKESSSRPR